MKKIKAKKARSGDQQTEYTRPVKSYKFYFKSKLKCQSHPNAYIHHCQNTGMNWEWRNW